MARRTKRTVPPELMREREKRFIRGDGTKIAASLGVSVDTVYIAIKHGQAEPDIILGISEYYAKQPTVDSIIEQAKQILK